MDGKLCAKLVQQFGPLLKFGFYISSPILPILAVYRPVLRELGSIQIDPGCE